MSWEAVKKYLMASNKLLRPSPDHQIQRMHRLAKLLAHFELDEVAVDSLIYVIWSHPPPPPPHMGGKVVAYHTGPI